MADTHTHHDMDHDPTVAHESRDINVRGVLWFAAIFVVVAVVLHIGLYYLLVGFRTYENNRQGTPLTEIEVTPERQYPPEPRLQPFPQPAESLAGDPTAQGREAQEAAQVPGQFRNPWDDTPAADWKHYRAAYDEKINSYGWVDQRNGIVRIPIEEAKAKLLKQGLAARPALPVTTTPSATDTMPLPGANPEGQVTTAATGGESGAGGAVTSGQPTPGATTGGDDPSATPSGAGQEPNR